MADIVFWGATGQCSVLHEALLGSHFRLVALIDDRPIPSPIAGIPIFTGEAGLDTLLSGYSQPETLAFCVTVGGANGIDRLALFDQLSRRRLTPQTIVHRTAFVATDASIGPACQLLALSAVCSRASLGRSVIINTAASVDHDCVIGDGVHIGPGARLAGEIRVGDRAFVGTGAVVLPRLRIGEDSVVGAGSVVLHDVPANAIVAGNPARPLK